MFEVTGTELRYGLYELTEGALFNEFDIGRHLQCNGSSRVLKFENCQCLSIASRPFG